ncbi:MAG: hypothetical protein GX827_05895 [Clostridiales bacterium]|jgi:uncharacterized repeat protein (TIGR02543 family)|nr:hypothetical protein [Clostridiales bacterium]
MKNTKRILEFIAIFSVLLGFASLHIFAAYPSSGVEVPAGSDILKGELIGEEIGWGGSHESGGAAAFDGNPYSFYDPTQASVESCYTGLDLGERYILTMVMILPRESQTNRYNGAMIQGSNDLNNWITLWQSDEDSYNWDWHEITEFEYNIGYRYYRYFNDRNHGDVAEVELYGYKGTKGDDPFSMSSEYQIEGIRITFDSGGGGKFDPISVNFGENFPELPVPEKNGFTFDGWFAHKSGGSALKSGDKVTYLEDITLYARWTDPNAGKESLSASGDAESAAVIDDNNQILSDRKSNIAVPVICSVISAAAVATSAVFQFRVKNKQK